MSSRMSSLMAYDTKRYPPLQEESSTLLRIIMLSSALLIISFFVTIFVFRAMNRDYILCKSEVDCADDVIFPEECHPVCQSKECIETAASMLSSMEHGVDPCKDFYNFACGKFMKNALGELEKELPISTMKNELFADVKNMIEDSPTTVPEGEHGTSFVKVKTIYDSCVSFVSREGKAPYMVIQYLEKFGIKNWPYLDSNFTFTKSLEETLSHFATYGSYSFFELKILPERDTRIQNEITSNNPELPKREIQVSPSRQANFAMFSGFSKERRQEIAMPIFKYFGLSDGHSEIAAEEVINFYMKVFDTMKKYRFASSNEMLEHSSPELDCTLEQNEEMRKWCTILNTFIEETGLSKINPKITFIISNVIFFKEIGELLSNTSDRIIANALALQIIHNNAANLNLKFRTPFYGQNNPKFIENSWKFCIHWLLGRYSNVLGAQYYTKIYTEKLHEEAMEIFEDIKRSTRELLEESTWIDVRSKDFLVKRVNNIYVNFEKFVTYATNFRLIDEFYEKLPVHNDSFFSNAMELNKFWLSSFLSHSMNNKRIPIRQINSFDIAPSSTGNCVGINLGFLVFPMITSNRPRCINLGNYGSVLAHEIAHGIERYLQFNVDKSENFSTVLNGKRKCLLDHYFQYETDPVNGKVNGTNAFSENVADHIGLNAILRALEHYHQKHGVDKRLPKMNFTDEQMLFISFAQNYCERNKSEVLEEYTVDRHTPSINRIFGTLRNNFAFSEAFNCPVGSFMNPAEKCQYLP